MSKINAKRTLFLVAIGSGTMLNPLNSSMISLALHSIQNDFNISFTTVSWMVSAFYLASAIAQPVSGKIGDLIGRKVLFLSGLILVSFSAFMVPFTQSFFILIFIRVIQAIGTSTLYPSGVALIQNNIKERQSSALAVLTIFASTTAGLGPTLGGVLLDLGGWHAIFLVNIPIVMVAICLGYFLFPKEIKEKKSIKETFKNVLSRLDVVGIVLFSIAMIFILLFLLSVKESFNLEQFVLGLILMCIFIWHELRTRLPFIDIKLFMSNPKLSKVYLQFIILNFFNYILFFGLPSYFQDALHYSARSTGLFMLFMSGIGIFISPLTGKWIDKSGTRVPLIVSSIFMLISAILLSLIFIQIPVIGKGIILSLAGVSYGVGNVALQSSMFKESPPESIGTASGLFQTSRYLGSIFATVLLGMVFEATITSSQFKILGYVMVILGTISFLLNFVFTKQLKQAK
ncbi:MULTISPECIES: MFS transporter [unclassified Clostridioides]|uniref:MFS transporter n=1 Tax=unclassified Clostridioides TaxID=2635829 RepID=UPI001D0CA9DA|nr:MFS transporter [Clostridioides sp. ES-S-0049-03]MCC0672510.1 MFS transporter [Clostridioides sp. ES-S-0145-01]MCC0675565.1 MFS transporter [Clostridioides sp. ES-W-0018-02]MCC0695329.1 MFS transporter [Clostridioides sp. ES-S-0048-02]MCC0709626.1 MFS transporter [Clostridioides sp. ES-W-0017-02]MCC0761622.1 MFS transporter [Clostridioides sp. ES-S-0006-03]UDN59610.1 MFS transporter [Clostridioides sp. ES-S-0010-02]UDN60864.1 MFS transporter [Clostridioides sp. ES-W-0016-02]